MVLVNKISKILLNDGSIKILRVVTGRHRAAALRLDGNLN
jgi:hypothetical protein